MKQRKYKDPLMQRAYNYFRTAEIRQDRSSSDRAAFWNGMEGRGKQYPHLLPPRNSVAWAIYHAGVDRAK